MPAADIAAIFIALARFTGAVYPDRLEAVDDVLAACQQVQSLNPSVTLPTPARLVTDAGHI